jgi:hypothetical protein
VTIWELSLQNRYLCDDSVSRRWRGLLPRCRPAVGFCLHYRSHVNAESIHSAYRLALKIVLVYVLWALIPHIRAYADLVSKQHETRGRRWRSSEN